MSRLRMTKSALAERRLRLATYSRALPSLELKRQQLLAELRAAREAELSLERREGELGEEARRMPGAADPALQFDGLARLTSVERDVETRLGIKLPVVRSVEWRALPVPLFRSPPWYDLFAGLVRAMAELRIAAATARARTLLIEGALRKTVQRINLLERLLIPQAKREIMHISLFLADGERTAIVRAKLVSARRRRLAQQAAS